MTKKRIRWVVFALIVLVLGACLIAFQGELAPTGSGPEFYVRYEKTTPLPTVLKDMQTRGVIRDAEAMRIFAVLTRQPTRVAIGTYRIKNGLGAGEFLGRLRHPIVERVRIPETNWAKRTANLLETKYEVCKADEYMNLVHHPEDFAKDVDFPLPKDSLEGYLYPDTYELAPLIGARAVIERQLKAFQVKVWQGLNKPADLPRLLIVASMVELESGGRDREKIAGVIENRLAQKMRLQIDASLLYGIQKWRRLTFADYRNLKTPYNTYLHDGLPPGPICSPDVACITAAMHPDQAGKYVYYVALPEGRTIFAATYAEHLKNIKRRKLELKVMGK